MAVIKFENVYKNFKDGDQIIEALKPSNISIEKGDLVAVIGPSGSGKSTFLTVMGGLQRQSGGKIYFMDKDISEMNSAEKSRLRFDEIGFILQSSNLIPFLKIKDQFRFVDKYSKSKKESDLSNDLMKDLDVYKRKDYYPETLSGGERQRVAIARALYTNPKLILADEPTSSLDTKKAIDVIEIFAKYTRNSDRAAVIVTHDERLLPYCDKIYRIVDGVLKEEKL